jgi:hypothetical protein
MPTQQKFAAQVQGQTVMAKQVSKGSTRGHHYQNEIRYQIRAVRYANVICRAASAIVRGMPYTKIEQSQGCEWG